MIELVKNGLHYRDVLWDAAFQIIKKLGPPGSFSTMHLRAGDFKEQGSYYSHFKHRNWIDSLKAFHSTTFNPGELIYISSDERNMTELADFREKLLQELNLKTATIYEFLQDLNIDEGVGSRRFEFWGDKKVDAKDVAKFTLNDLGAIEQIVCAHGRRFVGTYFSTFSAHILRLRGYLPFEPIRKEHNFWDRDMSPTEKCHYHSPPESCEPSWAGMFRGSMWASEYEEGWLSAEVAHARKGALKHGRMIVKLVEDPQVKANYERLAAEYAQQQLEQKSTLHGQSNEEKTKHRLSFAEQMASYRKRKLGKDGSHGGRLSRRNRNTEEGESAPSSLGLSSEKQMKREMFLKKLRDVVSSPR